MKRMFSSFLLLGLLSGAANANTSIYGFIEGYVEKVESSPGISGGTDTTGGTFTRNENAHEFQTPNVRLMVKNSKKNYSSFLNLNASSGNVETTNAWFEGKVASNLFKIRIGKMYRKFGLYNERLDAVPTYIGIEAPELFDTDHLLVTRTTNLMFHGEKDLGDGTFYYALTTGNDERAGSEIPLGGDLRYTMYGDDIEWTFGSSFYISGKATPTQDVGAASPDGGVVNYMKEDRFEVLGFYTELKRKALIFQAAYYQADHNAVRDGSKLSGDSFDTASLTQSQINRLCNGNMSTCTDSEANYKIKTWYIRTGYYFFTKMGEFVPYIQWDYYENPEALANKKNGGDNEAGLADDGKFNKQTVGMVYRPDPTIAIKIDASNHSQDINGESVNYAEVRGSFSYMWTFK